MSLILQEEGTKYCFDKRDMYGFWPVKSCSKLHPAHLSAERRRQYKIVPPKSDEGSYKLRLMKLLIIVRRDIFCAFSVFLVYIIKYTLFGINAQGGAIQTLITTYSIYTSV